MKTLLFLLLTLYTATAQPRTLPVPIHSNQLPQPVVPVTKPAVPCDLTAEFTVSDTHIEPDESVTFTNSSSDIDRYRWSIDGVPLATTATFSHTFTTPGSYLVELETTIVRDMCLDTAYAVIHVGSCSGNQTMVWYFGSHTGMRFTTNPPSTMADGALETREGCATICDNFGNLLFYTDGVSIWNRVHSTLPGGDATLGGSSSSTQSALIVPAPENPLVYYIFTTDATADDGKKGFGYAVVDMAGDNGKGIVTQSFIPLEENVGEKLTAVRHTNGRDIWVIVRGSLDNKLYSFLVTGSGIAERIVNTLGITYTQKEESVGAMKVSPTGNFLAIGNFYQDRVEVYPFNRTTGMVTDEASFLLTGINSCYGIEFSPNGTLLYASNYSSPFGITQFDLTAGSAGAIQSSAVFLPSSETKSIGSLQLGPDGKIYVSREEGTFLGAISRPELRGKACDYTDNAVPLQRPARLGLPGFVQDFVTQERVRIVGPTTMCSSSTANYSSNTQCTAEGCTWIHHGKATAVVAPDGSGATLTFTFPGTDTLILLHEGECVVSTDTLFVTTFPLPLVSLGKDRMLCSTASIVLDAGSGFESYRWQDGSTKQHYTVSSPGVYWVAVSGAAGCIASDTVRILNPTTTELLDLGSDTSLCSRETLVLRAPEGFQSYKWQDNSTEPMFTVTTAGLYFVEVETPCGSLLRDTLVVHQKILPMQTSGDTTLCNGMQVQLNASGVVSYTWTPADGLDDPTSSHPVASPFQTTTYTVTGIDVDGCMSVGTVTVHILDTYKVQLFLPDTMAIPGTKIDLPLRVNIPRENLPFYVQNLALSVRFRSTIFQVDSVTQGVYRISPGKYETLQLDVRDMLITETDALLTTIKGTVYLGDIPTTALELLDISLNDCPLTMVHHGSLTPDSVCSLALRQIQPLGETATLFAVSPNPASDVAELAVTTTEQGEHLLSLYNVQGQLIWRESFFHSGERSTHTLPVGTSRFGAGLYALVLTTPTRTRTLSLPIVH